MSYRCSCRTGRSTKVCDNKEIKKEYIEEFVLSELERHILNDRAIPVLVKKINEHLNKKSDDSKKNMLIIEEKIAVVEKQINNIIATIASGFIQDGFKAKMEELKMQKEELEQQKLVIDESENKPKITEVELKKLFSVFKKFVAQRNIPECKKFIQDFVKEVKVYKDHVEVTFNVVFNFAKNREGVEIVSSIKREDIFERYSNSFYIKMSS